MACSKVPFASQREARNSLKHYANNAGMSVYLCAEDHEGMFHIGHKAAHKLKRVRARGGDANGIRRR